MLDITIGHNLKIWAPLKKLFPLLVSQPASAYIQVCILLSSLPHKASALGKFYFTSPQPIKPKEASDSDFTIEDVMLWPGMCFLRSQCKRCSAGRLHNFLPYGSRSIHSCSTRRSLRIEDRMLPARHGFEPTSSTMTCPASPPFLFYFASTH